MNSYLQNLLDLFADRGFTCFDETFRSYFTNLDMKVNFNENLFLIWCSADRAQELESQGNRWARACNGVIFEKTTLRPVCETQEHMYKTTRDEMTENFKDYYTELMLDGTFIRLYYHDGWQMATCRQINGGEANWSSPKTFSSLFEECAGIPDPETLEKTIQYYYVMCHPENRLVSVYNIPSVYLVGKSAQAEDPEGSIVPLSVDNNVFEDYNALETWFADKFPCFLPRGFVFRSKKTGEKRCFEFPVFSNLRDNVRGNNARMDYRYLELLCEDAQNKTKNADVLRKHWHEYTSMFDSIDKSLTHTATQVSYEYYTTYTRPRMESRQNGKRPTYNKNEKSRYCQTIGQLDAEYYNKKIRRVDPQNTLQHMLTRLKPGVLSWMMFWDLRNSNT